MTNCKVCQSETRNKKSFCGTCTNGYEGKVTVYGLRRRNNPQLFYIGVSRKPAQRFKAHQKTYGENIVMYLLGTFPESERRIQEQRFFSFFKEAGHPLQNIRNSRRMTKEETEALYRQYLVDGTFENYGKYTPQKPTMKTLQLVFHCLVIVPHEFCHYVPALLLGLEPKWDVRQMHIDFYNRPKLFYVVATLSPLLVGVCVSFFLLVVSNGYGAVILTTLFLWCAGCASDIVSCILVIAEKP